MQLQDMFLSAESGEPSAQFNLAMIYDEGRGVPRNEAKALEWLERAVASEHHEALNLYAVRVARGEGVKQDFARAASLFRRADRCGFNCEPVYDDMVNDFRDKAFGMELVSSKRAFLKALRPETAEARCTVGEAFIGQGDADSLRTGRELLTSAATLGSGKAMYHLGVSCRDGKGVAANAERAFMWFSLAASCGFAKAESERVNAEGKLDDAGRTRAMQLAARWRRQYLAPVC